MNIIKCYLYSLLSALHLYALIPEKESQLLKKIWDSDLNELESKMDTYIK